MSVTSMTPCIPVHDNLLGSPMLQSFLVYQGHPHAALMQTLALALQNTQSEFNKSPSYSKLLQIFLSFSYLNQNIIVSYSQSLEVREVSSLLLTAFSDNCFPSSLQLPQSITLHTQHLPPPHCLLTSGPLLIL